MTVTRLFTTARFTAHARISAHARITAVGVGAAGLVVAAVAAVSTGAPAQAASSPLSSFTAPLLGSSATAQATRLPAPPRVNGMFAQSMGDYGATYTTAGPGAYGVLADRPAFVAKVGRGYQSSYGQANVTIIEVKPRTNLATEIKAAAEHDGVSKGKVTTSTTSDGWTVWSFAETQDGSSYNEAAYAGKGNQIVRIFCSWQSGLDTPTDTPLGCTDPAKVVLQVARTAPRAPSAGGLGTLIPAKGPVGLKPSFASVTSSGLLWPTRNEASEALTGDLGKATVDLYWTVPGAPGLVATVSATTLASMSAVPAFLDTLCPASLKTCTPRPDLAQAPPGGKAAAIEYHPEGQKGIWALETQVAGSGRLLDIGCALGSTAERAMTPAEVNRCTAALAAVRTAMLPR